jgi:GNAT superfamily N-acetyltransferase
MITVRPLGPADRERWEQLFREYIAFYERDEPAQMYARAWEAFMAGDRMHARCAEVDGRIVGIVHFLTHANTSLPTDVCYLQDLYTDADMRGRGVGRALITAVVEWARTRGCARVYWMTKEDNVTARALYDRVATFHGFIRYDVPLREGAR